jgi:hypothetical protein
MSQDRLPIFSEFQIFKAKKSALLVGQRYPNDTWHKEKMRWQLYDQHPQQPEIYFATNFYLK